MAIFDNVNKQSPFYAVEFSDVNEGNLSFFYVDRPVQKDMVRAWICDAGQEILAQTVVGGHPVFVTGGDKTHTELMTRLTDQGEKFKLHKEKVPLDLWKIRGAASVAGQSLQMVSAFAQLKENPVTKVLEKTKSPEPSMFMFAALNMTANIFNYAFGSQKSADSNQLAYLKDQSNRQLETALRPGEQLPAISDKRMALREGPQPEETFLQKSQKFIQNHSVVIGEIGLRYIAAIGLVFPMNGNGHWFGGWKQLGKNVARGNFVEAWDKGKNPKELIRYAGLGYLVGKGIALFTTVKDPYAPKEHTWVDTLRENILFKAGSLIEASAGATIAYNALNKNKINLEKFGGSAKVMPDYAGFVGGIIFATGYLIRLGADFGVRELNMKELQAHVSDSLAKVKPEQMPQLLADSAASLKDHFKGKPLAFGQLYTQMLTDLYQHHHVALATLHGTPQEHQAAMDKLTTPAPEQGEESVPVSAPLPSSPAPASATSTPEMPNDKQWTDVAERKTGHEPVKTPSASHAEQARASKTEMRVSV